MVTSQTFDRHDEASSPAVWTESIARLPALRLPVGARLLVVAPHPDDETLGCGGLIQTVLRNGGDVTVLTVTDGEGGGYAPDDGPGLVAVRAEEQRRAVTILAASAERPDAISVSRLGLPDGHVSAHEEELRRHLEQLIADWRPTLVLVPFVADGHSDHDLVGRVGQAMALQLPKDPPVQMLHYPVWAWRSTTPGSEVGRHLVHDGLRLDVTLAFSLTKQRAIHAYQSQLTGPTPVLHPDTLAHFNRACEVFVR